jgi:hypothetical protein
MALIMLPFIYKYIKIYYTKNDMISSPKAIFDILIDKSPSAALSGKFVNMQSDVPFSGTVIPEGALVQLTLANTSFNLEREFETSAFMMSGWWPVSACALSADGESLASLRKS